MKGKEWWRGQGSAYLDVNLLSALAVARNVANEIKVAKLFDGGVRDGGRRRRQWWLANLINVRCCTDICDEARRLYRSALSNWRCIDLAMEFSRTSNGRLDSANIGLIHKVDDHQKDDKDGERKMGGGVDLNGDGGGGLGRFYGWSSSRNVRICRASGG
ncbi:Uncharacterized protein Fot_12240 [Forsythia ovata]|uniref:Uncharacterized protein n=1 Tax=Forsythia ovata TaxID=205694 RepID=A0ABD1WLZ6_9LAMI